MLTALAVWCALSVLTAVFLCRAIKAADARERIRS